jgi:pimeloyl-ACP methyl ester carboxylesterase
MKLTQKVTLVLLLVVVLLGCSDKNKLDAPQYLVDATQIAAMSPDNIRNAYNNPEVTALVSAPVDAWRIVYNTKAPNGADIEASGLVMIPRRPASSILSLHRGTLFQKVEAPSLFNPSTLSTNAGWVYLAPVISSFGFIVTMPDLIGYGVSSGANHPFFITGSDGRVALDMLRATRELLEREKVIATDRLFVTGYSQGGATVLSLLKTIQQEAASEFRITAATAGGGAYNLYEIAREVLASEEVANPAYLALLIKSYLDTYFPNRNLNEIFREPYASRIVSEQLLNGNFSGDQIMGRLTTRVADLFQESFLTAFNGSGETEIKQRLQENSLDGFSISTRTRMYHGVDDEIIPIDQARASFQRLRQAGSSNLEFFEVPGNHVGAAPAFTSASIGWFAFQ